MTEQNYKNAGEVAVSTVEVLGAFEQKAVLVLRCVDKFFDNPNSENLPQEIVSLAEDSVTKEHIIELIDIFARNYLRPIVRHQPNCSCVGADENIFCNILKFCLQNRTNEAIILSSLLVRAETVGELVRKATTVAWLINKNRTKPVPSFFVKPNSYTQIH